MTTATAEGGLKGATAVSLAATLLTVYSIRCIFERKRFIDAMEKLPGPAFSTQGGASPWFGHMAAFKDTVGTIPKHPEQPRIIPVFIKWSREFADYGLFHIWIFNPWRLPFARVSVIVYDPELTRQLLESPKASRKLIKHKRVFALADPVVGSSFLALSDNAEWKHQRKMTAPAFHHSVLDEACRVATVLLHDTVFVHWNEMGDTALAVEGAELATRLTVEVLGRVAFSHSFGALRKYEAKADDGDDDDQEETLFDTYQALLTTISNRLRSVYFNWIPTRTNIEFWRHSKRLSRVIEDIVKDRLSKEIAAEQSPNGSTTPRTKDLLSQLLLKDEDGRRLAFKYIHGNTRMFLFAGHDTTASTLGNALWEIAANTTVQEKLRKEVDELFESLSDGEQPTCKQLMQLHYLDAVVKETLRMHSPVGIAREAAEDITLHKGDRTFELPKGTSFFIFPMYAHLSHVYWDRADDFVPERFLEQNGERSKNKAAWYPFSIGPRSCLGQSLAMVELKTIIAHLCRNYKLRPNKDAITPIPMMLLTVKPHEVLLDFERRQDIR